MPSKSIARIVGADTAEVEAALNELESHHVCGVAEDGTLYSRRMVREARVSEQRRKAGQRGGQARGQKQSGSKSEANPKQLAEGAVEVEGAVKKKGKARKGKKGKTPKTVSREAGRVARGCLVLAEPPRPARFRSPIRE